MELELYDYQQETIDALRAGFAAGHRSQLLYCPTGGGKTEMAMALMQATAKKGNRSAMILDRIVLCDQTSMRLDKYKIPHGVMQSGHWRYRPHEHIQVCSAQTLEKRGTFPGLSLLIADEAHDQRAQTKAFIKNNESIKAIGLSASPFTKGLADTYSNVVNVVTTEQLVERGRLAALRVFVCKQIDMTGAKKVAGEWSDGESAARGMQITGDVVSEWVKKTTEIFGGPRKTLVFCASVAHGVDLAQQFAAAGYNFIPVSYKDEDEYKREVIQDFSKPDTSIHGLIAINILTKGLDVPDVMIGVSARPFSKSFASHVQQMGRVMRSYPGKEFGVWICHSGNYLRFQEDWDEVYSEGVKSLEEGRETAKKEPSDKEKKEAVCPKCGCVWPSKSDVCPSCGFVRQKRSEIITVPGEVEEIQGSGGRLEKQAWWSGFLSMAEQRGKPRSFALAKYKTKFGVWPRMLNDTPAPPTIEMVRWEHSQRIAWAKSKGKRNA